MRTEWMWREWIVACRRSVLDLDSSPCAFQERIRNSQGFGGAGEGTEERSGGEYRGESFNLLGNS